jgi:hypothetical protein
MLSLRKALSRPRAEGEWQIRYHSQKSNIFSSAAAIASATLAYSTN